MVEFDDDEPLFSRDEDGYLIRIDAATEQDSGKVARLYIDGNEVILPIVCGPLTDAQGNPVQQVNGKTIFRHTTIYDAAVKLFESESKVPMPILCHQQHMKPAGVCRVCSVLIGEESTKKSPSDSGQESDRIAIKLEAKLAPSCHRQVKSGMHVLTTNPPKAPVAPNTSETSAIAKYEKQRDEHEKYQEYLYRLDDISRAQRDVPNAVISLTKSVRVLIELLVGDHLKPAPSPAPADELAPFNELKLLKDAFLGRNFEPRFKGAEFSLNDPAFPEQPQSFIDDTSPVFLVDHSACILCDRCSRACNEVKENHIIGRTRKGASAGIGFDLDAKMGASDCVQCGECMVSCPTSSITFKPVAQIDHDRQTPKPVSLLTRLTLRSRPIPRAVNPNLTVLNAASLTSEPLFHGVPPKFLLWQQGLVVRRHFEAGDVLCKQGDPGNLAFLILSGRFKVEVQPQDSKSAPIKIYRTRRHVIVGEMACLSGRPRNATVTAEEAGDVLEVRRNVLDRIMRRETQRDEFQRIYAARALNDTLINSEVFAGIDAKEAKACARFLRRKVSFVRVGPKQTLFRQRDKADDACYLVRLGHVRVAIQQKDDIDVILRGPGSIVGEMGLLNISRDQIRETFGSLALGELVAKLNSQLEIVLKGGSPACGSRNATCSSLDHLELARIPRIVFLEMIRDFPAVRRRLIEIAVRRLYSEGNDHDGLPEFVRQGLYQAQNLLALDLNKCTRCDECTRACADHHGKGSHGYLVPRLLRVGHQFGNHLVTTSCRSCKDAYCMIGCPVDAIHRGKQQQIIIENHCIGCGLCAENCPYGNIWIHPNELNQLEQPGVPRPVAQEKAATCDLCDPQGLAETSVPQCVHACPHDAAHRMSGEELWKAAGHATIANI